MMVDEGENLIVLLFRVYIIIILSGIITIPFVSAKIKPIISIISVSLVALITGFIAISGFTKEGIEFIVKGGSFFGDIPVRIDALSAWFILIINFTSVTGVLYGAGYLKSAVVHQSVISFHNMIDLNGYILGMKNISLASAILITIISLVFGVRWIVTRVSEKKISPTWGCGYLAPNKRMQYTGKSFSKSFGKLFNFIMIEKKRYDEIQPNETFPDSRKYRSHYLDIFEAKFIDPALHWLTRFIDLFQFIQNGKIQAYVIYGIVFILAIFIGTI